MFKTMIVLDHNLSKGVEQGKRMGKQSFLLCGQISSEQSLLFNKQLFHCILFHKEKGKQNESRLELRRCNKPDWITVSLYFPKDFDACSVNKLHIESKV